jgi:hypothetical protein
MNNMHFYIVSLLNESDQISARNNEIREKLVNRFGTDSVTLGTDEDINNLKEQLESSGVQPTIFLICFHNRFVLKEVTYQLQRRFENAIPLHYSGDFRQLESTLEFWELNRVKEARS